MKNKFSLIVLAISLLLGLFMRGYQYRERFMYNHDNDLSSWIIRDVVVNHHLRLIGQQTSEPGIFIGPLFYYSLIPFYLATNMDPIGGVALPIIIGLAGIASIYYVFYRLYGKSPAAFAALIYAASWGLVINERDVVPTTPVLLWSVWYFYAVNLLFRGKKPVLLVAVLFALVWHLNLALVLLAPLAIIGFGLHYKKYSIKEFVFPVIAFLVISAPLIAFEARHNFVQSRSLVSSLVRVEHKSGSLVEKYAHVFLYAARNSTGILYPEWPYSVYVLPTLLLVSVAFLSWKKFVPPFTAVIYVFWIILYAVFFAAHPINLSEYYLNGMNILTIAAASLFLSYLFSKNILGKALSISVICYLLFVNLNSFIKSPVNRSGYIERSAIAKFIKADSAAHGYPCVSVSYITNPGYNLGYRYLFWIAGLRVNQPKSGSPVYTIVFPHPLVNHLDKTFGALGLILPDYSRYNESNVAASCAGPDQNLTDPMFGYSQ